MNKVRLKVGAIPSIFSTSPQDIPKYVLHNEQALSRCAFPNDTSSLIQDSISDARSQVRIENDAKRTIVDNSNEPISIVRDTLLDVTTNDNGFAMVDISNDTASSIQDCSVDHGVEGIPLGLLEDVPGNRGLYRTSTKYIYTYLYHTCCTCMCNNEHLSMIMVL